MTQQVMLVREYDEERWHDRYGEYIHTGFLREAFKNKKVLLKYMQEKIYEDAFIDVVVDFTYIFDEDEEELLKKKGLQDIIQDKYFVHAEGIRPNYKTLKPYLKNTYSIEKNSYNLITLHSCIRYVYLKNEDYYEKLHTEVDSNLVDSIVKKDAKKLMKNCKKDLSVCAEVLNVLEKDYCEWDLGGD